MKKNLLFIGLSLSLVFVCATFAGASLYRTLRQGSVGSDVRELQILLNKDPETRIALSGAGSLGHETSSFGSLTKKAVIKFQTKYASDVLYPAGLSFPTGVVGAMTRAKLNSLYPGGQATPPAGGGPLPPGTVNSPHIDSVSPLVISASSQTLTISGENFTPNGNQIVVASESDRGVGSYNSMDGKTITISFVPSIVDKIKNQLATYKNASNYQAILSGFINNLTGETISVENGITYVRAIIFVKNSNGSSNAVNVKVDIKSFLQ